MFFTKPVPTEEEKEEIIDNLLAKAFLSVPRLKRIKAAHVCQRWKKVVDKLWERVQQLQISRTYINENIHFHEEYEDISLVKELLRQCGRHLERLQIYKIDSEILTCIRDNCPNLFLLHLDMLNITADHFADAFSNMKKMMSLNIDISCFSTNEEKLSLIRSANYLESVQKDIKEIHLCIHGGPVNNHSCDIFNNLQISLSRFKSLIHFSMKRFNLKDQTVISISENLNLNYLDLRGCRFSSDTALRPIMNLQQLEYLNLSDIYGQVDDELLRLLSIHCKRLQHLDISNLFILDVKVSIIGLNYLAALESLVTLEVPSSLFLKVRIPLEPLEHLQQLNATSNRILSNDIVREVLDKYKALRLFQIRHADVSLETLLLVNQIIQTKGINFTLHVGVSESLERQVRGLELS